MEVSNNDRIKSWQQSPKSWENILGYLLIIPMNQRKYAWEIKHIEPFCNDIIDIFEEGKHYERMGIITCFKGNGEYEIYDGQQRTITIVLFLIALAKANIKLKDTIYSMLSIGLTDLYSEKYKHEIDRNQDTKEFKMPKLYCTNPNDRQALIDVFNDKYTSYNKYIKPDKSNGFICSECDKKITTQNLFVKHLQTHKININIPTSSNIYNNASFIESFVKKLKYSDEQYITLYQFIKEYIDLTFIECMDSEYVSRIFDWENNRGKSVKFLDIIKNRILSKVPDENKFEVWDGIEKCRNKCNSIYTDEKLFNIAIQIYNKTFYNKVQLSQNKIETGYNTILKNNTYNNIKEYLTLVDDIIKIINQIFADKYGRIIKDINLDSIWYLIPIFYVKGLDKRLIHLIVKFYIRNLNQSTQKLNNMPYTGYFITINNKFINDPTIDYYNEFLTYFNNSIDKTINKKNYIKTITDTDFNCKNAKRILVYMETCINTDDTIVPLNLTLEHVIPKAAKTIHANKLGNLTLLEGCTSNKDNTNEHKGNSSLGDKDYKQKQKSYKDSTCKITRNIAKNYKAFGTSHITARTKSLAKELNSMTKYEEITLIP